MNAPSEKCPESGFVLPYVLVVIAILAIAGTIAAQRLHKASQIVAEMQDRARAERLLVSAEAAATYSILTGNTVKGGYDISPESPILWEFGLLSPDGRQVLREDAADSITKDIWPSTGALRRYTVNVADGGPAVEAVVAYRDVTGLVSLNEGNSRLLQPVLEFAGAKPADARRLLAALSDYTDPDDIRRQDGAESFNYRTQNLPPPSNAPLRSYAELGRVMGWAKALPVLDTRKLMDMTTLLSGPGYRQTFASKQLKQTLGLDPDGRVQGRKPDLFEEIELNNQQPSQLARFTLWAARDDGRYQKRVVDIERFLVGVGEPYRRHWVYDSTVLENDFISYAGLPITAKDPLQFDELDHVVHASALRP